MYSSFLFALLFFLLLLISYLALQNTYVLPRIIAGAIAIMYFSVVIYLLHKGLYRRGGALTSIAYLSIAAVTAWHWGINAPIAVLLLSFFILLSSVMFGPRYILPSAALTVVVLCTIQFAVVAGLSRPDTAGLSSQSTFGDVAVYSIVIGIFACVGWLSGTQLQNSLVAMAKARDRLKDERDNIKAVLAREKERLRKLQLEERVRLYEFAELGQYTTLVLHDLSNQIATLSLEIGESKTRDKGLVNARETIKNIEHLIESSNRRISRGGPSLFHPYSIITDTVSELKPIAAKKKVRISYRAHTNSAPCLVSGDPDRFRHIISILITNAVQAYDGHNSRNRKVTITASYDKELKILFSNKGSSISESKRKNIFAPHHSTKKDGHGIGLYIARKIIEDHFSGRIALSPKKDVTEFAITIPLRINSDST